VFLAHPEVQVVQEALQGQVGQVVLMDLVGRWVPEVQEVLVALGVQAVQAVQVAQAVQVVPRD
jgi:hypothetical protein